ncbi:MAG TPA: DUF885 domain-containing protein [Acidimicrobiales bacterium]|nr:DUF885 domain-containing protein [Acidimicrobiales bacterium]
MDDESKRSEMFVFADGYVEAEAVRHPMFATYIGVSGFDDRLDDFSMDGARESRDAVRQALAALETLEVSGLADKVAHAVMTERLEATRGLLEKFEMVSTVSVMNSPVGEVRQVFELMSTTSADDAQVIRRRLDAVEGAMSSWREGLDEAADTGHVAPRRQSLGIADQAALHAEGSYVAFARRVAQECGVDFEDSGLAGAASVAQDALGETSAWLREEYAPRCRESDAAGPDRYALWSSYFNGTEVDFDELYSWGVDELRRIHDRMVSLGQRLAPSATSLVEVADVLDRDDAGAIVGEDALLERLESFIETAVGTLNGVHFDIDPRVQRCDARIAPEGSAAAPYYIGASEDLTRPGTTWYPTMGATRFPWWRIASTWYHESVPGHHLQDASIVLRRDQLSRFQRSMAWTSGVGEGWALYAERFMDELNAFSPAEEFGYLSGQALRAARIVVDLGLHLGYPIPNAYDDALGETGTAGQRWTPDRAVALVERWVLEPHDYAVSEVDRYLGGPGQAIAYKLGERTWMSVRDDARRRLADQFDLMGFHAAALGIGPMGLAPFVDLMGRWRGGADFADADR